MKNALYFPNHDKLIQTLHSHLEYFLQKVFKMTGVKLTIGRLSLINIYDISQLTG